MSFTWFNRRHILQKRYRSRGKIKLADTLLIWSNIAYLFAYYIIAHSCYGLEQELGKYLVIASFCTSVLFHVNEVFFHDVYGKDDDYTPIYITDQIDNVCAKTLAVFCTYVMVMANANLFNFIFASLALLPLIEGNILPWDQYVYVHSLWHVSGALEIAYSFGGYCKSV